MEKFTNPLDNIKVASPCPANWNEMIGDARRRHCAECKLNVYDLSEMTRTEAENFIINAEGRVCVKFYRRADGTVLTKDCPVGWQAFRNKTSRLAKAFVSVCAGILGGVFAFHQFQPHQKAESENSVGVSPIDAAVQPNRGEDFEVNFIAPIPDLEPPAADKTDKNFTATVGMLDVIEKPNKKETNSKKARRR
jgi:hypothetical protein